MGHRATAKTLATISLVVSVCALGFSGLTWRDQHRTAEANLTPNERLLVTCKFISLHDGESPMTYDLAISNPGNRAMTLCSAMACIAQKSGEIRQTQLLLTFVFLT